MAGHVEYIWYENILDFTLQYKNIRKQIVRSIVIYTRPVNLHFDYYFLK